MRNAKPLASHFSFSPSPSVPSQLARHQTFE
jgi:hypothetical protein